MTVATSWLFVPGDRPDRIVKAVGGEADRAIVDLEDAVAASAKERARETAAQGILAAPRDGARVGVRVNAVATGLFEDDIAALIPVWPLLDAVVLPMVPDALTVRRAALSMARADTAAGTRRAGPRLIPQIETAQGVLAAHDVAAAHPRVLTLAFGPADLSNELGVTPSAEGVELLHARSRLILAAAAARRTAPVDGPWLNLDDLDGLRRSTEEARRLGFSGKQVIHPKQIATVHEVFAVSASELAWARTVDEAFTEAERRGVSSIRLPDGTFVDYPVAHRARTLLARAR
ncbi:MAG: CoA ester lyase [Streptosporangiales bacterium]|nr:CoA ester lyase [Streptosporangiales bacterium]